MNLKPFIRAGLAKLGYTVVAHGEGKTLAEFPPDMSRQERELFATLRPFTMTSLERFVTLMQATNYVVRQRIPGAIVECGVWRGGSMMAVAKTLLGGGDSTRELYLYDTFEGMPQPTEKDIRAEDGATARDLYQTTPDWCRARLEEVQANMRSTGYPTERMHFVQGKVEETIPGTAPAQIALLRLDTDWFESTRHELVHLFPRLASRGVLILDDYGCWQGARDATDQYFATNQVGMLLCRIDVEGRIGVKL